MRPPRQISRALTLLLPLAAVACAWYFFAPPALGGTTNWVVTDGISMEPRFHAGDLVLVRAQDSYRVGQIVAYHNRQLGTIVLHRIIARAGSRYVFKGDNNNFVDFEDPRRSQLIGALWLHLPGVGADLASIRSPGLIGALFALGTLLLGGAAFTRRRRRGRRERRRSEPAPPPAPARVSTPGIGLSASAAAIALAAAIPFALLALLAFTRPSSTTIATKLAYTEQGHLSYGARPPAGPAYPAEGLRTGDPIFTHVVGSVGLHYSYRFTSAARSDISGRAWLSALLASTSGWKTTIPLGAPAPFRGGRATAAARLDVSSLLALVSRVQSVTGVRGSYTMTILPHVEFAGTIDGTPLHGTFAPATKFSLDELEIRPMSATGAAPESSDLAPLFAKSATGTATVHRSRASRLSLGAIGMPTSLARAISLGGLALVACALGAAAVFVRPRRRDGETAEILSRYGSVIVPVERVWQLPGVAVIDVADIDALVRIAAHYERSILHERTEYGDAFWVSDESGQFRYAVWEQAEEWVYREATGAWEQEDWARPGRAHAGTAGFAPQTPVFGSDPAGPWEQAADGPPEEHGWAGDEQPVLLDQPGWTPDLDPAASPPAPATGPEAGAIDHIPNGMSSETLRYGAISAAATPNG